MGHKLSIDRVRKLIADDTSTVYFGDEALHAFAYEFDKAHDAYLAIRRQSMLPVFGYLASGKDKETLQDAFRAGVDAMLVSAAVTGEILKNTRTYQENKELALLTAALDLVNNDVKPVNSQYFNIRETDGVVWDASGIAECNLHSAKSHEIHTRDAVMMRKVGLLMK